MKKKIKDEAQILVYKASDGSELPVKTDGETVWMTIDQMVKLFGRNWTVLIRHVNNAIREGELDRGINVQNLHNIQTGRGRPELMYDLDVMISVGYRVKSPEGVRFRRWATRVLREMLLNRVEEIREISRLRRRVDAVEGDIKQIKGGMSYLVQQLTAPTSSTSRRIGFDGTAGAPSKPYGKSWEDSSGLFSRLGVRIVDDGKVAKKVCFAHIAICDVPRTGWNKVMVEVGRFVEELKAAGVEFFAGVPDSLLKSFCAHVTDDCEKCYSTTSTPPMGSDPLTQLRSWNHDSQLAHSYLCEKKAQA